MFLDVPVMRLQTFRQRLESLRLHLREGVTSKPPNPQLQRTSVNSVDTGDTNIQLITSSVSKKQPVTTSRFQNHGQQRYFNWNQDHSQRALSSALHVRGCKRCQISTAYQRSCGKLMFSQASVILFGRGGGRV